MEQSVHSFKNVVSGHMVEQDIAVANTVSFRTRMATVLRTKSLVGCTLQAALLVQLVLVSGPDGLPDPVQPALVAPKYLMLFTSINCC